MALILDSVARDHLRVDRDAPIDVYLSAAELWAQEYLDRRVFEDQDALDAAVDAGTAGDCPMVINDLVRAGILLLAGHLYENRESVVIGPAPAEVPLSVQAILHPYRKKLGA